MKKNNKLSAFTLAEVMILLLTLSILMAAFAPVFTRRYSSTSADDVWSFVMGSSQEDAYYDNVNKTHTAQAFIGLTPVSKGDVATMSDNLYSKVVIAASKELSTSLSGKRQNQIQFRYGNSAAGELVGNLFAGNGSLLLGGLYGDITNNAKDNAAYGVKTMSSITSGSYNTALGYGALNSLTTGNSNSAIGNEAGNSLTTGSGNVFVGVYSGKSVGSSASYNTLMGHSVGYNVTGSKNVAVGYEALYNATGSYNTALGSNALNSVTSGSYNTAVGYNAMSNLTTGSYNTAIGDNACLANTTGSYKTCIGSFSGSEFNSKAPYENLFTGNHERVFIGTIPVDTVGNTNYPAAVLEVHNVTDKQSNSQPIKNVGNESVVVNGNLIVRGQPYFETVIYRQRLRDKWATENTKLTKGLVLYKESPIDLYGNVHSFMGWDGIKRSSYSREGCSGCKSHDYRDARDNCVCTAVSKSADTSTTFDDATTEKGVSRSYDWTSPVSGSNGTLTCDANTNNDRATFYTDRSVNKKVYLERHSSGCGNATCGTDKSWAHIIDPAHNNASCCPNLVSDIRLKNVGEGFTSGLDEIKKLRVYNFTFKNDAKKIPQVGVMAQDLKAIFPNAVSKNKDGYYQIRIDEIFYAAINAIKTLNTKIERLATRVSKDRDRIANLKNENKNLNAQLDKLEMDLAKLEAKKTK